MTRDGRCPTRPRSKHERPSRLHGLGANARPPAPTPPWWNCAPQHRGRRWSSANAEHNRITADPRAAEADLAAAEDANRNTSARLPLGQVNPAQQILEVETKLLSHAVKIAAYNTTTALARDVRLHTGYARANDEAHTLIRQALTHSADIDPDVEARTLTVRLDPMPTGRATRAIAELCQHLTASKTRYPGTNLVLRYQIKPPR